MTVHHAFEGALRVAAIRPRDHKACPLLAEVSPRVGLDLRVVDDLQRWVARHPAGLVVVAVTQPSDWITLQGLTDTGAAAMALLHNPHGVSYRRALRARAVAVAPLDAPRSQLAEIVRNALRGNALIPRAVLSDMSAADAACSLTEADVELLTQLARGHDTKSLAAAHRCSERTMYRRLQRVYSLLQVRGRAEATQLATSIGLTTAAMTRLAVSCQCGGVSVASQNTVGM